jgi:ribosomal protein S18 acetylase RimI-like enzyme
MVDVVRLNALPPNMGAFVADMAPAFARVYGEAAAADYAANALGIMGANAAHPSVLTHALCGADGSARAISMAALREGTGSVTLLHVLPTWRGMDFEQELVRAAFRALREQGAENIRCELLPMCPLHLDPVFAELGFRAFPRRLMGADSDSPILGRSGPLESQPLTPGDLRDAASVMVDAYTAHGDADLHPEVNNRDLAHKFLLTVLMGGFGEYSPAWCRRLVRSGETQGMIAGCRVAPGTGFVLQVAVRRAVQGTGLGGVLLRELAQIFREDGLQRMVLGVTSSNRARRLYERLGFTTLADVTAYVWNARGHDGQQRVRHDPHARRIAL